MADINVIVPNRDVKHISKLYNLFGQVFLGAFWNAVKLQIMFSRVLFQVINLVYSGSKVFGHCVVIFFDFLPGTGSTISSVEVVFFMSLTSVVLWLTVQFIPRKGYTRDVTKPLFSESDQNIRIT